MVGEERSHVVWGGGRNRGEVVGEERGHAVSGGQKQRLGGRGGGWKVAHCLGNGAVFHTLVFISDLCPPPASKLSTLPFNNI